MSDQDQRRQAQKSFPAPISVLARLTIRSKRNLGGSPSFITSCLTMRCRRQYRRCGSKSKDFVAQARKEGGQETNWRVSILPRKWLIGCVIKMNEKSESCRILICRHYGESLQLIVRDAT